VATVFSVIWGAVEGEWGAEDFGREGIQGGVEERERMGG